MSLRRNLDIVINTKGDTKKIERLAEIEKNILNNVEKVNEKHKENLVLTKKMAQERKRVQNQSKQMFVGGQDEGGVSTSSSGNVIVKPIKEGLNAMLPLLATQLLRQDDTTSQLNQIRVYSKYADKNSDRQFVKQLKVMENQAKDIAKEISKYGDASPLIGEGAMDFQNERIPLSEQTNKSIDNIQEGVTELFRMTDSTFTKGLRIVGKSLKIGAKVAFSPVTLPAKAGFKTAKFGVKAGVKGVQLGLKARSRVKEGISRFDDRLQDITLGGIASKTKAGIQAGRERYSQFTGEGAGRLGKGVGMAVSGVGALGKFTGKKALSGLGLGGKGLKAIGYATKTTGKYFEHLKKGFEENTEAVETFKGGFKKMSLVATGALGFIVASSPGLQGQLKLMQLNFKLIAMELGESLMPIFEAVGGIVEKITEKFMGLSDGQKQMIVIVLAVIAGLGALAGVFSIVGSIVGVLSTAFTVFGVILGAVNLPIILIAGAIIALILIFKNWDKITAFITERFGHLPDVFKNVGHAILKFIKKPVDIAIGVFEALKNIFLNLMKVFRGEMTLQDFASKLVGSLVKPFEGTIQWAYDTFGWDWLGTILEFIQNAPSFAIGTDFVPEDMLAMIHRGEMIIPAKEAERIRSGNNGAGFSGVGNITVAPTINLTVTGTGNDEAIARRASDMAVRELERLISRI